MGGVPGRGALIIGCDGGARTATKKLGVFQWEIFQKRGHSVRRPKRGSASENKTNFGKFSTQNTDLDDQNWKLNEMLLKKGTFGEKLSLLVANYQKGGCWVRVSWKRGSIGKSEWKNGGQCVHAPPLPIFRECCPGVFVGINKHWQKLSCYEFRGSNKISPLANCLQNLLRVHKMIAQWVEMVQLNLWNYRLISVPGI